MFYHANLYALGFITQIFKISISHVMLKWISYFFKFSYSFHVVSKWSSNTVSNSSCLKCILIMNLAPANKVTNQITSCFCCFLYRFFLFFWDSYKCICSRLFDMIKFLAVFTPQVFSFASLFLPVHLPIILAKDKISLLFTNIRSLRWSE